MLKQNGYAQYQNSRIMTASPAELTLMLYEGAIKFGNIAIMAMQNNEPAKAHENVVKVEKIIQNFRDTLDKNILSGKISRRCIHTCLEDAMKRILRKPRRLWKK